MRSVSVDIAGVTSLEENDFPYHGRHKWAAPLLTFALDAEVMFMIIHLFIFNITK